MQFKRLLMGCLVAVLLCGSAWAYDGYGPAHKHFGLQTQVFTIVNQYWKIQDLFNVLSTAPTPEIEATYNKALEIYRKQSIDLGKRLLAQLNEPSRETVKVISDIYCSLDVITRQALYLPLSVIKNSIVVEFRGGMSDEDFREYFPGYGYSEPGFKYRKGREVARETKGTTWQSEEHSITSTFSVELTVNIDLLNILKGFLTGGVIKNLVVKEQWSTTVNGEPMIVAKVSFQVIKAIVTKTNRKFEVNKIWFELLRTKSSSSSNATWEVCGKTYEIINEPTGEDIVTGVNQAK
jgi:hypothetical protein